MHQPTECLPTNREALDLLAELSERHNGSVCLRRYAVGTLICDTKMGDRKPGEPVSHAKVASPTWAVSVRKGGLLGTGSTPEEAIKNAVQEDFRRMVRVWSEQKAGKG